MTAIDDYRAFLKAQLKSAGSILKDAEARKESGEIMKSNYISMWRREVKNVAAQINLESTNPELFAEEAGIWAKRMAFPIH